MDQQSADTLAKSDEPTITHRLLMENFEITLDDTDQVMVSGDLLYLRPAENQTFCELIRANGSPRSFGELVQARQNGHGDTENTGSVKVHVSVIRRVLSGRNEVLRDLITTIYGIGYYIDRRHYVEPVVPPEFPALTVGNTSIYFPVQGGCVVNGDPLHLGPIRTHLLKMLIDHGETVFSWTDFATVTYGPDKKKWPEQKIFEVLVCTLRKKLREALGRDIIETVWGRGYHIQLNPDGSNKPSAPPTSERPKAYTISTTGVRLTAADLPDPAGAQPLRWVPRRKAIVACLVSGGVVSRNSVLSYYPGLSNKELDDWITTVETRGVRGLRQTSSTP